MCVRLILRHSSCSLGEFLKASIHPPLVVCSVLQLHLSAELLLGTPDVRHLGEDEVEDLHDFIPSWCAACAIASNTNWVCPEGVGGAVVVAPHVDPSEKGITGSNSAADWRKKIQ